MISEEGFKAYLRPYIEGGIPFTAYWHPHGFGLLKTGPQSTERVKYVVHLPGGETRQYRERTKAWNKANNTKGAWMETEKVPGKPYQISKTKLARWRAINDKLRRMGGQLITVEFDGVNLMTEGGNEPWSL